MDRPLTVSEQRRLKLDDELREIQMDVLGYEHTYFDPPEKVRMQYDAIVYTKITLDVKRANNKTYLKRDGYQITVISRDSESPMPGAIQDHFSLCSPGKPFKSNNLCHFPFTIFY